jgi:hypothetical protein
MSPELGMKLKMRTVRPINKQIISILLFLACSGCTLQSLYGPQPNQRFVELDWFIWWAGENSENLQLKEAYISRIKEYLRNHPATSQEISEHMLNGDVYIGMTEEQVLAMAKPIQIIKQKNNTKILKYSERNKLWHATERFLTGDSKGGSSITVLVYLEAGIVKNLTHIYGT